MREDENFYEEAICIGCALCFERSLCITACDSCLKVKLHA